MRSLRAYQPLIAHDSVQVCPIRIMNEVVGAPNGMRSIRVWLSQPRPPNRLAEKISAVQGKVYGRMRVQSRVKKEFKNRSRR